MEFKQALHSLVMHACSRLGAKVVIRELARTAGVVYASSGDKSAYSDLLDGFAEGRKAHQEAMERTLYALDAAMKEPQQKLLTA